MKRLRTVLTIIIAVLFLSLLTSCGTTPVMEQEKEYIAVIDLEKAVKAHPKYAAWKLAVDNELSTQQLKDSHVKMVKEQALFLSKMQQLQTEGRSSFYQADYAIKMSEAHLAERERLKEIERKEKQRIDEAMKERVAAIEEEYKLPLFNLKTKIETLRPLPRSREQAEQEKKEHIAELAALQAEKNGKINALYKESEDLLADAMKNHEEESVLRLSNLAKGIYDDIAARSRQKINEQQKMLANIPEAFDKTMASLEKQLLEQKMTKDKLYTAIYDDILSQVTKIAMQKKFTVVLVNVEINIKGEDITQEVISGFLAK